MKLIVAVDKKWGIGKKNDLLFRLPLDMQFFRQKTAEKIVVMGYNTLLSFPQSKPLKNRINIVLAPEGVNREDCTIVHSLAELSVELSKHNSDDVFIVGGAMFYRTMYPFCDEAYITKVDADGFAEVFFDNLDNLDNWKIKDESEVFETNGYNIRFLTYKNSAPLSLDKLK